MRRLTLGALAFALTLTAFASFAPAAQAQTICPFCIIGYKCCIQGNHAKCIPETNPCN